MSSYQRQNLAIVVGFAAAVALLVTGLLALRGWRTRARGPIVSYGRQAAVPIRPPPSTFPANTHKPDVREGVGSGSIELGSFSPGRDLVYVDDSRVWWESDHDDADEEDDHSVHRSLEPPLRRLIELVAARGATLKVQDTYRPSGIHNSKSLHKEGRALDVTCDELSLEDLAKLCWSAGFDWVYHETRGSGGAHVHCSVKR